MLSYRLEINGRIKINMLTSFYAIHHRRTIINNITYTFYNLTKDEIKIIEGK